MPRRACGVCRTQPSSLTPARRQRLPRRNPGAVLSPRLAVVYLATVPCCAAAKAFSRRRLRSVLASLEESFGAYHSRQIDAIRGIDTVKAPGPLLDTYGQQLAG